ncbi:hypothetical protein MF406_16390 [Georgenia sp. TF02-10]|uniref:hypothetical protein n=1 Tax=Georgenia sp. TF02-10 TaxID=2917725 RepID=UPI001FA7FBB8|nr:hypothetical protein [Georgenia sp. TF02-10]UNX54454.1 hypothetical protein MF406_16390 [Georgenia sp. TF02-10]
MARSITVHDVPDETGDALAARAALTGRLRSICAHLVELADTPDPQAWLAAVRARKAATHSSLSATRVLEDRAADRP